MLDWIIAHFNDLLAIWGAIVAICSIVVKLTPTQKDDTVWAKILKILDLFSVVMTKEDAKAIATSIKNLKKKK